MAKLTFQDNLANVEAPGAGNHVVFSKADGLYLQDPSGKVIKLGSAILLKESDASASVADINTLEVNVDDGLFIEQPASDVGRIALAPFTGDMGAGGAQGAVPAPAAGDGPAGKVLFANGTWGLPGGGVSSIDPVFGRLTLVSGEPVMGGSYFNRSTVYLTPYNGNRITLYYNNAWNRYLFSEISIALNPAQSGSTVTGSQVISNLSDTSVLSVGMLALGEGIGANAKIVSIDSPTQVSLSVASTASSTVSITFVLPTSKKADVYAYYNGSEVKLELCQWANPTTRAVNLAVKDGVYVKYGDYSRRYLGTVTASANGATEYSPAHPYLLNVCDYLQNPYYEIPVIIGSRLGVPETGVVGSARIPYRIKITGYSMLANQVGSAILDILKDSYDNYPPTSGDTICGGNYPTLLSAQKGIQSNLTGWTLIIEAGEILYFVLSSVTTIQQLEFTLMAQKWFL